jgi:hypothetical protein
MGEMFIIHNAKLDLCDHCNQQGSVSGGEYIKDSYGENMIFKCFNCLVKEGKRR